jgi:hypothetical protein
VNQKREQTLKELLDNVKAVVSQKSPSKPIRVTLRFKDEAAFEAFTRKLQS